MMFVMLPAVISTHKEQDCTCSTVSIAQSSLIIQTFKKKPPYGTIHIMCDEVGGLNVGSASVV